MISHQLSWKRILALSATLIGLATLALCLSALIIRHASVARLPSALSLPKAASSLQSHMEAGDIRFGHNVSTLKDTMLFPLDSISLERTLCFGDCPVYIMTFRRDGHASLITHDIDDNEVKYYAAEISPEVFARATQLAQSAMRSATRHEYAGPWSDDYFAIMRVQSKDGLWCVSDYGQVAPVQVWALEELLNQFRNQVRWEISPVHGESKPYPSEPECTILRKNS